MESHFKVFFVLFCFFFCCCRFLWGGGIFGTFSGLLTNPLCCRFSYCDSPCLDQRAFVLFCTQSLVKSNKSNLTESRARGIGIVGMVRFECIRFLFILFIKTYLSWAANYTRYSHYHSRFDLFSLHLDNIIYYTCFHSKD